MLVFMLFAQALRFWREGAVLAAQTGVPLHKHKLIPPHKRCFRCAGTAVLPPRRCDFCAGIAVLPCRRSFCCTGFCHTGADFCSAGAAVLPHKRCFCCIGAVSAAWASHFYHVVICMGSHWHMAYIYICIYVYIRQCAYHMSVFGPRRLWRRISDQKPQALEGPPSPSWTVLRSAQV